LADYADAYGHCDRFAAYCDRKVCARHGNVPDPFRSLLNVLVRKKHNKSVGTNASDKFASLAVAIESARKTLEHDVASLVTEQFVD